uniref:hypothetical protein n=1 Tax=Acidocella sp. C78 TaxID=1671486 RepID=UPI00191BC759|nr:hypothetical protein [Acidocella sp. C78]
MFFNEIDILTIRLNELYDVVDYFVVCEATKTFQGADKPLYFKENIQLFEKFLQKIIHVVVDDMPDGDAWAREHHQRNSLRRVIQNCESNDFIIISDTDEIIRRETIQELRQDLPKYAMFDMPMFQYFLNLRSDVAGLRTPFGFQYDMIDQIDDFNQVRNAESRHFCKFGRDAKMFHQSGWHMTYIGGVSRIRYKLNSYSHTEEWARSLLEPDGLTLLKQFVIGYGVGNGWHLSQFVEIDETFPKFVLENKSYFIEKDMIRDPYIALRELQRLARYLDDENRNLKKQIELLQ